MANSFYLSVKAASQGDLNGETGKHLDRIPILGFSFNVVSPRDPQSGLPTGKRMYKPISVYKDWGVISPQLLQALANNENLPAVTIGEIRVNPSGKEVVYMEIHLTNATVSGISVVPQRQENQPIWTNQEIEEVSFTFQKIEVENKVTNKTAIDDWEQVA